MRFLIINGPNLGYLGKRKTELYGKEGMEYVPEFVRRLVGEPCDLRYFQSNSEGCIIDRLEQAFLAAQNRFIQERADQTGAFADDDPSLPVDGIVINAGALTHTSLALGDCLEWIGIPYVEVHLTNILKRSVQEDPIRGRSFIAGNSLGLISGFGVLGYALAVAALADNIKTKKL